MSLTRYERQVLANQHRILSLLLSNEDDKKFHKTMEEVYLSGYSYEYFEYGAYDDELPESDCKFVYEVINMYDDLYYYWSANEEISNNIKQHKVVFPGFDLNDSYEHRLYSFSKFLIEDLKKFHDTRELLENGEIKELNSHGSGPGANGYRLMLEKYVKYNTGRMAERNRGLNLAEIEDILNYYN